MGEKSLIFLRDSSDATLQQYELVKRNDAANLLKQLRALISEYVDQVVEAELARRWREARAELCKVDHNTVDLPKIDLTI